MNVRRVLTIVLNYSHFYFVVPLDRASNQCFEHQNKHHWKLRRRHCYDFGRADWVYGITNPRLGVCEANIEKQNTSFAKHAWNFSLFRHLAWSCSSFFNYVTIAATQLLPVGAKFQFCAVRKSVPLRSTEFSLLQAYFAQDFCMR